MCEHVRDQETRCRPPVMTERGHPMPTRRTMAVVIITMVAAKPVFGLIKCWAGRKLSDPQSGTLTNGAAQIAAVVF